MTDNQYNFDTIDIRDIEKACKDRGVPTRNKLMFKHRDGSFFVGLSDMPVRFSLKRANQVGVINILQPFERAWSFEALLLEPVNRPKTAVSLDHMRELLAAGVIPETSPIVFRHGTGIGTFPVHGVEIDPGKFPYNPETQRWHLVVAVRKRLQEAAVAGHSRDRYVSWTVNDQPIVKPIADLSPLLRRA